jgi:type II secretory pathway component PulL
MRERALKIVLVLVGLLFLAGFYFLTISLWHAKWHAEQSEAEPMFLSLYITLGIFLLLAVRNPSAHRSLIAYAGWANIAHATVMALMAIHPASDRRGLLTGTAIFIPIGVALLALAPAKQPAEMASTAVA